jgi:hypothetical protein
LITSNPQICHTHRSGRSGEERERTDLVNIPRLAALGGITVHKGLDNAKLDTIVHPVFLQKLRLYLVKLDPPGLANDVAKDVILVGSWGPIKDTFLGSTWNPASEGLVDHDTLYTCIVFGVLDLKGETANRDCFPCEPTGALESQNFISRVAEGLVLWTVKQVGAMNA